MVYTIVFEREKNEWEKFYCLTFRSKAPQMKNFHKSRTRRTLGVEKQATMRIVFYVYIASLIPLLQT